jgi:cytoskeleton protein RodZ
MSDAPAANRPPAQATSAGALLRQARQAQGLHIAALSAAIKVTQRKLELLESDQFEQLPDATFTRALAQTVCRTLKIDAAPVLALLPPPKGHRLEEIAQGLNTPFRERPGRLVPTEWASFASPLTWIAGLLVLAAAFVYFMPPSWVHSVRALAKPDSTVVVAPPAAEAASVPASPKPSVVTESVVLAASPVLPASAGEVPANVFEAAAAGVLQFHATAQSWIEVTDGRGKSLIARLVEAGEDVGVDGVMPLKVRIGNAGATQVVFRGQAMELAAFTRDNVARLELK